MVSNVSSTAVVGVKASRRSYSKMYDDYVAYFKKYVAIYGSQTAIFLQVGKFFEFYDILDSITGLGQTTTKKITDILGVKLTYKKASGPGNRDGLWAGVPTQSLHGFAGRLTRENWTVVVIEEQHSAGKITRSVTRILSPGTHVEAASLESCFLSSLWLQETKAAPRFSASTIDLSTGALISFAGEATGRADTWAADDLVHFFQVHPPREVIVYWAGDAFTMPTESAIRERVCLPLSQIHVRPMPQLSELTRTTVLQKSFSFKTLLPIREALYLTAETEMSLVCLLNFIDEHVSSMKERLAEHTIWKPDERVHLGNNVLSQVNFLATREEDSILGLFTGTHTQMGKRAMRKRLLYPVSDTRILNERLDRLDFIRNLPAEQKDRLHIQTQKIADLSRLHRKIQTYTLQANEVLLLEESYSQILSMARDLSGTCLQMQSLAEVERYREGFHTFFDIEKASRGEEDTYFLPEAQAPRTFAVEAKLRGIRTKAAAVLRETESWAGVSAEGLKLESRDSLLFAVSCSKTNMRLVSEAIKKKAATMPSPQLTTQEKKSGATIQIPLFFEYHEAALRLKEDLEAAFQTEFALVCQRFLGMFSSIWHDLESWIAELDVSLTLTRVCTEKGYTRPVFLTTESSSIEVQGLRHPIIESLQIRTEYVTHDVSLGSSAEKGWLVYGMNASGKSSMMKALGICILLAQAGCYVPARSCRLSPYTQIFTRILNHDNIWAGLSSFAVEMIELREILKRADARSLVLGDEVCSGTESTSATSLVAAALQWLIEKQSSFVFATHLHSLLDISAIRTLPALRIRHLRVRYNPVNGRLLYDRTLQEGPGSSKYGLEVARALELPFAFIETALQFRNELCGTRSLEEAPTSQWNAELVRTACEICACSVTADLEVHHIRPRAEAQNKLFADGAAQDHIRNLVTLCKRCHDTHHAGRLEIGAVKQTSEGEVRVITEVAAPVSKSKWSVEEQRHIMELLREKPHAPAHWILHELGLKNIHLSASTLSKIKKRGGF